MATDIPHANSKSYVEKGDPFATPTTDTEIGTKDLENASTSSTEKGPAQPARTYKGFRWFLVCVAIYSSAFLYGLDQTIVADIQAAAVSTFGSVEKLGWLGIGFPLGSIATILSLGKAYGIWDVKYLYIASLIMFAVGSALCGGAPNMNALIVGRVTAGAGGAGMYLGVLNILAINTTLRERPMYMGLTGLVWGGGCILGPVIGGAFADSSATWRWAFYINLLIFAICSPIYLWVLESFQPQPDKPFSSKLRHMDWLGVTLNAAVYTTFVVGFTFAGATWAWKDGRTITLIVVFIVMLICFFIQQGFSILTTPARRLFPVDFLRNRTLVLMFVATSAAGTTLLIPIYYIPLYFSFVHNNNGSEAAVRLLPFICVVIFCQMFNGVLMPKYGYYFPWYTISGVFLVIGGSLMYTLVNSTTSNSNIYGYSVLLAIGAGIAQQSAYSIAPSKVEPDRVSDANGFINFSQIGAIVIALTISSTVFQNVGFRYVKTALEGLSFTDQEIHASLAGAKSTIFASVTPEVRNKVIEGIVKAINDAYILVIVAGGVILICSALMKKEKLFLDTAATTASE